MKIVLKPRSEGLSKMVADHINYQKGWLPISEAPHETKLMLWLKADEGMGKPIGHVLGVYGKTEFHEGWCECITAAVAINLGLRQDLITHFKYLEEGPEDDGAI